MQIRKLGGRWKGYLAKVRKLSNGETADLLQTTKECVLNYSDLYAILEKAKLIHSD